MSIKDSIRLRPRDGKCEIFLDLTPQAKELGQGKDGTARLAKLFGTYTHDELLKLVKAAVKVAKERESKLDNWNFYIPSVSDGKPMPASKAVEALKAGKVLTCTVGRWQKPKIVFGDPDFKATKKSSPVEIIDY